VANVWFARYGGRLRAKEKVSTMRTIFPYFSAVVVKLTTEIVGFSKITEVQESQ
jgi:hypothetical protein